MSRVDFNMAYCGPALSHGTMNIHDLAPALLAFGDLLKASNASLNPERAEIDILIKTLSTGSFEITLAIDLSILEHARSFITSDEVRNAAIVLTSTVNVIQFFIWRGERKAARGQADGDRVTYNAGRDIHIVDNRTDRLLQDRNVRQQLPRIVRPLSRPGIDSLTIDSEEHERTTITSDDAEALLRAPDLEDDAESLHVDEIVRTLSLLQPAFEGKYMWRVDEGDGPFHVRMEDGAFLTQIEHGERFGRGDRLRVRLRIEQRISSNGQLSLHRSVVEVLDHIRGPQQLPFGEP